MFHKSSNEKYSHEKKTFQFEPFKAGHNLAQLEPRKHGGKQISQFFWESRMTSQFTRLGISGV